MIYRNWTNMASAGDYNSSTNDEVAKHQYGLDCYDEKNGKFQVGFFYHA